MSSWWNGSATESDDAFVGRATEHLDALLRFARRLTRNTADAEDLVQDTLVRALARRAELRSATQLKPWLLAIERSTWLNTRRGLRHRLEILEGGLAGGAAPEPHGDLEREIVGRSIGDELVAALGRLPEDWREALWLREVEELSYDEIAEVMECPIGTVRSRLARARAAMIEHLRGERSHGV